MRTAISPPALPARLNGSAAVTRARRKGKGGRPSKFTSKLRARIIEKIALGLPFTHACAAVGISFQSFRTYQESHTDFCSEVERAVSSAIEKRLAIIERAANLGDTLCARWLLEHLHPQHFARSRLEIEAVGQLQVGFAVPPALLERLAAARAEHEAASTSPPAPALPASDSIPTPDQKSP
jgi:hypothetical protein